jgi:hypothetical protein
VKNAGSLQPKPVKMPVMPAYKVTTPSILEMSIQAAATQMNKSQTTLIYTIINEYPRVLFG